MAGNARKKRNQRQREQVRKRSSASKQITRSEQPDGTVQFELTGDLVDEFNGTVDESRRAFREQFGRDPGPDDPLAWDPDEPTPTPLSMAKLESEIVETMESAGIDPALIYAYQQTGLLVTAENRSLLSEQDLAEWDEAIDRYEELHS